MELACWVTLANTLQIMGLRTTSASRAAFFVQLESIFVPLVSAGLGLAPASAVVLGSSALSVAGVAVLASDSIGKSHAASAAGAAAAAASGLSFSIGDGLEVLCAVVLSVYVLRTKHHVKRVARTTPLVAVKVVTQAVLATCWALVRNGLPWLAARLQAPAGAASGGGTAAAATAAAAAASGGAWWALPAGVTTSMVAVNVGLVLWAGVLVSATTSWMQAAGQRVVSASDAAILFATKPLWATACAAVVLGESFGRRGVVGGIMVLTGVLLASWNPSLRRRRRGGVDGQQASVDAPLA